jgi:2-C-methyl-D-erythritol 2,4-cyclodiphosphate synthase
MDIRVGEGYDAHRLVTGRKLVLGGVFIEYEMGLQGHSDADVLTHAVMDALLGAVGMGDIGKHFPDTDEKYRGVSSLKLLKYVYDLLSGANYSISNIDAVIVAQKPKLAPYMDEMRKNIADVLNLPPERVNVKATTTEMMGFEGRGEGISARAVCLVTKDAVQSLSSNY